MFSTIEDIYVTMFETDRNQKEKIHLYDLAGITADVCVFCVSFLLVLRYSICVVYVFVCILYVF